AREPFGALEKVADGVWALVSTPLGGDRTTLSNGGIIAGRNGVLAIEGFNQVQGAEWLASQAMQLTGKRPTHVVLTHYHADHANGLAGYLSGGHPVTRATERTRDLVTTKNLPADAARSAALGGVELLPTNSATTIDLGGRSVHLIPRGGHTDSDVTLELDDPAVVFCGDLVWNGMFPNYVDAQPSRLSAAVRAIRRSSPDTIYVPGHGAIARATDFDRYVSMIDEVEHAARRANASGMSAADAGASFTLPATLGDWVLFSKAFYPRAFEAWYRELKGA
ncbi:MAG: beta-lactamase domain protein, partial [Gemmatimonadetes bacterium]|nr:beta-lactamase domain protein [Gemmatimonadota bacterium]